MNTETKGTLTRIGHFSFAWMDGWRIEFIWLLFDIANKTLKLFIGS